jgi:hypothetical protein
MTHFTGAGGRGGAAPGVRPAAVGAALALLVLVGGASSPLSPPAEAAAARGPQRIAGTWDVTWRSRRGAERKGLIVVEQRGSELTARIEDRGNVTATGTIAGAGFTLRGTRYAIPFTITGRVSGRKMTGSLTALGTERRFAGTRRGR